MDSAVRSSERSEIYRYECHWSHASRAPVPFVLRTLRVRLASPPPLPFHPFPFFPVLFHSFPSKSKTERNGRSRAGRLSQPHRVASSARVRGIEMPIFSGPREFPRRQRNAPLISLSTGRPLFLFVSRFALSAFHPVGTVLRHSNIARRSIKLTIE